MMWSPGTVILGRYRIDTLLGAGAQALVYSATDRHGGGSVAVRALLTRPDEKGYEQARARFDRAAGISLNHPNVIRSLDYGTLPDGTPVAVQMLINGIDLDAMIGRHGGGPLPAGDARRVLHGTALGLEALHGAGLVHRDIKPSNLLVIANSMEPVIIDLGLAKESARATITPDGTSLLGTPAYMAPEQWHNPVAVDARADLYALGVIAYQLITGKHPYPSLTNHDRIRKAACEVPATHPVVLCPGAPKDLAETTMRLLAKRPQDRPQSASEVMGMLDDRRRPRRRSSQHVARCLACGARLKNNRPSSRCPGCQRVFRGNGASLRVQSSGEQLHIPCGEFLVGRAQLSPREQCISRRQFRVRCGWISGRIRITDAGTRTTKVNGHTPSNFVGLHRGDRISVGRHFAAQFHRVS